MTTKFLILISFTLFVITGCKTKEQLNQPPTCKITSPTNNQHIMQGKNVNITVDANDPDGTITEVRFYIDNAGTGSNTSFPYNYNWNTSNENLGTHNIKATCFDNSGNSTSNEVNVIIEQGSSVPVAAFTATPTSGTAPLTVSFTDQSANSPTSWQWNFGDGGTSTQQNPTHTYHNSGTYTVSLTTTNSVGSNTKTQNNLIVVNSGGSAPAANFTASPTSGTTPLTITFTDQSANSPTSWQWDFGDGGTSSVQNSTHTYNNTGIYSVSLTASNNYGSNSITKNSYITVTSGGGTFTDPRDGQTYNIVTIGNQTWFAENLNYQTADSWWYNNSSANGDVYGRLYTRNAALSACPNGWHLPSDEEWKTLEMALGMSLSEADAEGYRGTDEGEKMKSTSGWLNNGDGTNSSGFNALPGGYYLGNACYDLGSNGDWWSSSEYRYLNYDDNRVGRDYIVNTFGFSVRCLKN